MPQLPALSRRPLAPALLATLTFSLTLGCATVSPTAPANPLVAGRWQLDKSASDLVETKVTEAVSAWQAKLRKRNGGRDIGTGGAGGAGGYGNRGGRHGGAGGGDQDGSGSGQGDYQYSGEDFDAFRPLGPDFAQVQRRLVQVLTPPESIKFDTGTDYVRIAPDSVPPRDYHTDEEFSRIDEYGTAKIDAGWSGNAFELQARYSSHATLIEHYEVDAHDTLRVTYHLSDPMVGKIDVTNVYHRS
jgi:hypothetical protein